MASALSFLHKVRILHRDVKPAPAAQGAALEVVSHRIYNRNIR